MDGLASILLVDDNPKYLADALPMYGYDVTVVTNGIDALKELSKEDKSYDLVKSLKGMIPQYAASNGTTVAQTGKLTKSGLINLLDGVFLSEQLGAAKPSAEFFEQVFKQIGAVNRERVLIVGDSLSSDILGAKNAGIKSCWYNPSHSVNTGTVFADFEADNLNQIPKILGLK